MRFLTKDILPLSFKETCWFSIACGVFVPLFLLIFLPFGIDDNKPGSITSEKTMILIGWGLLNSLMMILYSVFVKILMPEVTRPGWKLWQAILWYSVLVVSVGLFNSQFHTWLCGFCENSFGKMAEFILNTFLLMIFPISFFELYRQYQHLKKQPRQIERMSGTNNESRIVFTSGEKEKISISPDDLFYIRADDNYLDLWIKIDDRLMRKTIRGTLKEIESMKEAYLIRCHRSYMVNVTKIITFSKREGKGLLALQSVDDKIPVSKVYINYFDTFFTPKAGHSTPNTI